MRIRLDNQYRRRTDRRTELSKQYRALHAGHAERISALEALRDALYKYSTTTTTTTGDGDCHFSMNFVKSGLWFLRNRANKQTPMKQTPSPSHHFNRNFSR